MLDAFGALLAVLMLVWAEIAAADRPAARARPVVLLLLGGAALVTVSRLLTRRDALLVPRVVAIGITGALVLGYPSLLHAGGAPTGYANANATLAALGAIAAAGTAAISARPGPRRAWAALALLLATSVAATGSVAASLALLLVGVLAVGAVLLAEVSLAIAGGVVAASLFLGITAAMAAGGDPLGLTPRRDVRLELWARALEAVHDSPLRGIGPGAYGETYASGTDADLRWAHHGFLQQAAEQGVVGLVLMMALVGWGYARLWEGRERRDRAVTIAGASALSVVALHATVDHVLHQAAVPLTLAVLVGWATADRMARGSLGSRRPPR